MLQTKEHYELMAEFEKEFKGNRMDKEAKQDWPRGIVYEDGMTNNLFLAYRKGYGLGKAVERMGA